MNYKTDKLMAEKIQNDIKLAKVYVLEANRLIEKYNIERTQDIEYEIIDLGSKLIELVNELEQEIDFDTFIKIFELNESENDEENEVDRDSSFIDNLIMNYGSIGKVIRTRLIKAEKLVKEMVINNE